MRNNKLALFGIAALTLAVAAGCAKPPQQEIDALTAAVTAAEQAEAPKYAADAWSNAQQARNAVNAELEAQANKFALFRSYTKTKELIAAANAAAASAKDAGVAGKEAARNAANEALSAAKASLRSTRASPDFTARPGSTKMRATRLAAGAPRAAYLPGRGATLPMPVAT